MGNKNSLFHLYNVINCRLKSSVRQEREKVAFTAQTSLRFYETAQIIHLSVYFRLKQSFPYNLVCISFDSTTSKLHQMVAIKNLNIPKIHSNSIYRL